MSSSTPPTFNPLLRTPRLLLSLFNPEDESHVAHALACLNDPTNVAATGDYGIHTPSHLDLINESTLLLPNHTPSGKGAKVPCVYIIHLDSLANVEVDHGLNDDLETAGPKIGIVSLVSRSTVIPPDIGWGLLPAYHRNGYAPEAAARLLRYVMYDFEGGYLNAEPHPIGVIAWPNPDNVASVRVAEKIGMTYMGEITADGGAVEVVYGVAELMRG